MPCSRQLTRSEMEAALRAAGWPAALIPLMIAIGLAESSGCVDAYGTLANGEQSIGLWQINMKPSLRRGYDRSRLASDPVYNAAAALQIYRQQGLSAWGAYTDERYKSYLYGAEPAPASGGFFSGLNPLGPIKDLFLTPVPSSSERFAPFLGVSFVTPKQRFTFIAIIALVVIVFYVREF